MKTNEKNVRISLLFILIFALSLLVGDITAPFWIDKYVQLRNMNSQATTYMLITIYAGSAVGWYCLYCLFKLFKNIASEGYFTTGNSILMKKISGCCITISLITLLSAVYYIPFGMIGLAALFMSLIVNVVKDAFVQAQKMKDELDLTI